MEMVATQIVTCNDNQTLEMAGRIIQGEMEICDGNQNCMGLGWNLGETQVMLKELNSLLGLGYPSSHSHTDTVYIF